MEQAGFDPEDRRAVPCGYSVRVRANGELKAIMERIGIHHPAAHKGLADMYLLEAGNEGHLDIRYQLLAGHRYAGMFDLDFLVQKLASAYAAFIDLVRTLQCAQRELAPSLPALARPAPHGDAELHEQLAMLVPEDSILRLPIQQLSQLADIRRLLERADGTYRVRTQRFEFEEDIDPSLVVAHLVSGEAS